MTLVCLQCNKKYSSSSHLRRHEASHQSSRRFVCGACSKSFVRSDVFRRHLQQCSQTTPPVAKPGRKKASCDQCATAKVSCDRDRPCERCLASNACCTYSRLLIAEPSSDHPREEKMSIGFLLSYTKTTTFFSDLKQLSGDQLADQPALECPPVLPYSTSSPWSPCLPSIDLSFSELMCEMLGPSVGLFEDVSGPNYTSSLSQTALDPLQDQVDKILRDLQQYISILENPSARSTQSKSTALEQASQVVNGHSIRLGINAYFRYVYPNCPFVHQPSFDPGSASSTLLLSMFAAGHAVLQDKTCTPSSELMDLIEDYVFNDPTLNIPVRGHIPTIIQAMQAATIAIQMRAATGDPRIQQRTRDCRFPRLMNALRSYQTLSLKNTTIRDFQTTPFDWQLFIQTECLIRITFAAYMLDAHFTIFFRAPARATIQEMAGDLPCADALFMADTSQSCQTMLESTESVVLQPPSLASLVRTFMDTSFDPQDRDLQGLTVRHLFLLILGFHAVIFSAQRTCIMVHVSHAVERALERWEMLWNTVSNNDNNQLASIGLMKFAPQFCVLAKMMLDPGIESGSLSRVNVWTKDYVHDFMRKAK